MIEEGWGVWCSEEGYFAMPAVFSWESITVY